MAKEVGTSITEPNEVTYDLKDRYMLLIDSKKLPDVFPDKSLGLTVAKVHRPSTQHHDLVFYRFDHHEAPVARITHQGDSMTTITYELGRAGTRFSIKETDIQERLKELLAQH